MKTCAAEGCNNPVFSNSYCKYHQYMRKRQGGDLYKRKSKPTKEIVRRTKKRAKDERHYSEQAKAFFDEAVINGTNICVFCGQKVTKLEGLHHLKGRTNDYLLDKEWWRTVHNKCHVDDYHQADHEHRSKQPWYNEFLLRIKDASEELWRKELRKGEKAVRINPERELFNDD
jgi:hypothetical protein